MWQFNYQAQNDRSETERGTLSAESVAAAIEQLSERGLEVTSIERVDSAAATGDVPYVPALLSQTELLLEPIIKRRHSWLPLAESLLAELPTGPTRRSAMSDLQRLRADMTVDQFLNEPTSVSMLPLLASDAEPNAASPLLREWLSQLLEQASIRRRRQRLLAYPATLLLLSLIVFIGLALFVVPIFEQMFSEFGLQLPSLTFVTFWLSRQLTTYALRTLFIVLCAAILGVAVRRWYRRRLLADRYLGTWVAGTTRNLWAMSRLTGTMAELLSLGLPLAAAVRGAAQASGHRLFAESAIDWLQRTERVTQRPISAETTTDDNLATPTTNNSTDSRSSHQRLPPSVLYALTADRQAPSLPLLRELAVIYRETAQFRQDRFANSLPIFGIMLVGCVVGFVILSLFMPLVSMITSLS